MIILRLAGVEVSKRRVHDRYNLARSVTLEVVENYATSSMFSVSIDVESIKCQLSVT